MNVVRLRGIRTETSFDASTPPPAAAQPHRVETDAGGPAVRGPTGRARMAWDAVTGGFALWRRRWIERTPISQLVHDALLRQLTKGRPPIGLPVLLLVAAALAWPTPSSASAGCFRYGETVTLSGHYFADVAPTDDGVIRDSRNDDARRATLLVLDTPLCMNADTISQGIPAAATVQLNCAAVHPADGTALSLEGRLLGAHTRNGQTPVLLMCP